MTAHEIPVFHSETDFPAPFDPVGEGLKTEGEGRTSLSEDLLPNRYELNREREALGLPPITKAHLVEKAVALMAASMKEEEIPSAIRAHFLTPPPSPESAPETNTKPRPTMRTSAIAFLVLSAALAAGWALQPSDPLKSAADARTDAAISARDANARLARAAEALSGATAEYKEAKEAAQAAAKAYRDAYESEGCFVSGNCR